MDMAMIKVVVLLRLLRLLLLVLMGLPVTVALRVLTPMVV
jgi:hypothetical protein